MKYILIYLAGSFISLLLGIYISSSLKTKMSLGECLGYFVGSWIPVGLIIILFTSEKIKNLFNKITVFDFTKKL